MREKLVLFMKCYDMKGDEEENYDKPSIWRLLQHPDMYHPTSGDQQAAMFGQCGFNAGSVKATFGTGTFCNINTAHRPLATIAGLYPVIGKFCRLLSNFLQGPRPRAPNRSDSISRVLLGMGSSEN